MRFMSNDIEELIACESVDGGEEADDIQAQIADSGLQQLKGANVHHSCDKTKICTAKFPTV